MSGTSNGTAWATIYQGSARICILVGKVITNYQFSFGLKVARFSPQISLIYWLRKHRLRDSWFCQERTEFNWRYIDKKRAAGSYESLQSRSNNTSHAISSRSFQRNGQNMASRKVRCFQYPCVLICSPSLAHFLAYFCEAVSAGTWCEKESMLAKHVSTCTCSLLI